MKKRKIAISIFAVTSIVSITVGYSILKQDNSNKYDQLAVMVKQDDGSYIRSNMSLFGNDDYEFDHAVCVNGTTVTANPNGGVNLSLIGTDKCNVYLRKKIVDGPIIKAIKESALPSTSTMFSATEPTNTIRYVIDDNFSKEEQTYTVDETHQSYYMTYADSYKFYKTTMLSSSGYDYSYYTLTSPQVGKYSDIYSELAGKYIVNYEGHNSSTAVDSSGKSKIYKVVSATADSITYIPSSYTIEFTNNGTTGVYTAEDDYGTSYYFRGNVKNNYVKFGKWTEELYRGYYRDQSSGKDFYSQSECKESISYRYGCNKSPKAGKDMYWRIVRINGDGSLRLMYDGTDAYSNGTVDGDRMLSSQRFNSGSVGNTWIGYMYGSSTGTTYDEVHENKNPSLMKTALETWYEKNFVGTTYESKIGDMSFCNDRSIIPKDSSTAPGTGIGETTTYYGAYGRLNKYSNPNPNPSLVCPQKPNDLFTKHDRVKGNGKLTYPIGLLTADEVALAGGLFDSSIYNRGYYICKGVSYWLATPYYHSDSAHLYDVFAYGNLSVDYTSESRAVVPVINLSREVINNLKGSGTMDDPYHF